MTKSRSARRKFPVTGTLLLALFQSLEASAEFEVRTQADPDRLMIAENGQPVLTYNFGTVAVPVGVSGKYAVARSDYVHPLFGPKGEVLTKDFSPDHPHHRGIYWAWPEVTWKGDKRDLHALQGVFARPVKIVRQTATNDCAVIEAENVWKWGDADEIVREFATITARAMRDERRVIDFEFRFVALVPGVTVARRHQDAYGGFNLRFSARQQQQIVTANRTWAALSGIPPDGKSPVHVAILQDARNPYFPGDWIQYPNLNWLQPTFPAKGTAFELKQDSPLVLRYRLVISGDGLDAKAVEELLPAGDAK